jgi:hypothetical protein
MPKQSWNITPKTSLGYWSVGLIIAMPLLFILGFQFAKYSYPSIPAGGTIIEDIFARPALALSMVSGMAAGILAFITGLMAIIRQKERALLVYVSSALGALLVIYLAMEFAFPH